MNKSFLRECVLQVDRYLKLVARSEYHWQVVDQDGVALVDVWPTVNKYLRRVVAMTPSGRVSHAARGIKASVGGELDVVAALYGVSPGGDKVWRRPRKRGLKKRLLSKERRIRKRKEWILEVKPPRTIMGRSDCEEAPF